MTFFDEYSDIACLVEPGVIHDDDFPWRERGCRALAYILGKNVGIAVSIEAERRLQLLSAKGSDDARAAGAIAGFFSVEPRAALSPSACQAVAMINTAFVHIDQCGLGNVANRFTPQSAGDFIALGVQQCFLYARCSVAAWLSKSLHR